MGKGVDKGLPKAAGWQVGDGNTEHPDLKFFFLHKRVQPLAEVFDDGQQRAALEMVNPHIGALKHLKGHFMARDEAPHR